MAEHEPPPDPITEDEAAHILGVTLDAFHRYYADTLANGQGLSRAAVEALALRGYRLRKRYTNPPGSYWVTTKNAAPILGVNRQRVRQLAQAGRIPFETTAVGVRLYRRYQLEVVANARLSRKLQA